MTRPPKFLTTDELADMLAVSRRQIIYMRERGTGPTYVTIGRAIRYPPRAVQELSLIHI